MKKISLVGLRESFFLVLFAFFMVSVVFVKLADNNQNSHKVLFKYYHAGKTISVNGIGYVAIPYMVILKDKKLVYLPNEASIEMRGELITLYPYKFYEDQGGGVAVFIAEKNMPLSTDTPEWTDVYVFDFLENIFQNMIKKLRDSDGKSDENLDDLNVYQEKPLIYKI